MQSIKKGFTPLIILSELIFSIVTLIKIFKPHSLLSSFVLILEKLIHIVMHLCLINLDDLQKVVMMEKCFIYLPTCTSDAST